MNRRRVLSITGLLLLGIAGFLCVPLLLALWDRTPDAAFGYGVSSFLTFLVGFSMRATCHERGDEQLHRKDAFGIVALTWAFLGIFGGLPFLLEGSITDPTSAFFEAVSGFTTTGATVVGDVGGLSRATNLWRCLMHWVGGMGVVVLFVAVFPNLGVGAKQLFRTEVAGPTKDGVAPRIRQTASTLWWLYAALTGLCALMLWSFGLSPFDAIVHALSTLGTGGFSSRTASAGHFDSAAIDWTLSLFMLVAGTNFALYYGAVRGRWRDLVKNDELRFYLTVNAIVIALIAIMILPRHAGAVESIRYATFQVLAVTTTTGFMTEDFDTYPNLARILLFGLMFMGGCAGSTAGGLKAVRVLMLIRLVLREIRTTLRPQAIFPLRIQSSAVPNEVVSTVLVFCTTFFLLFALGSAVMVALGLDLLSGMSATVACLASIGPGLGSVGPAQNYAAVPAVGKLLLSSLMIAGRLELFVLFAVFNPECWRR